MILYHFIKLREHRDCTNCARRGPGFLRRADGSPIYADDVRNITKDRPLEVAASPEGLLPLRARGTGWGECFIPGAPKVVWLTSDPRTVPCEGTHIFRIAVEIPKASRKLISWPEWRDENVPGWGLPAMNPITNSWWGYAGRISPEHIVDFDLLRDQVMPWIEDKKVVNLRGKAWVRQTSALARRRLKIMANTEWRTFDMTPELPSAA